MNLLMPPRPDHSLAPVLSGGNALGAYHGGAYQALHEAGWLPDRVVGASAGAVSGAVICGNAPEHRLERLMALWRPAPAGHPYPSSDFMEQARRSSSALSSMLLGQPGLFGPRSLYGPQWNPFGNGEPPSLYDATPMIDTLERLVDFQLLNTADPPLAVTAVDIGTGEDVVFDARTHELGPDHIRASSALLPAFSPVVIGERLLADAGLSVNLPLDAIFSEENLEPLICIAVDLVPLRGPPPRSFGEVLVRMQDLLFATQSRRAIAAWQEIFDARVATGNCPSVTLLHIAYADHQREVSGKAFDFSPGSARQRWDAGNADMSAALISLASLDLASSRPGLRVLSAAENDGVVRYEEVTHKLGPRPG